MSEFSRRLKALRENRGWSKTYVAKTIGLSNMQTYANWEYGRTEPDFQMTSKIANLFNVSTDYLLGNDTSNSSKDVDLKKDPVVLSYGGKPVSKEDMDIIKAILERHQNDKK